MSDPACLCPGAPPPERAVTVLAVSDSEADHDCLDEIFRHSKWRMLSARSCREAFEILESNRIPVVVCECALPDGSWKSLLNRFAQWPDEPLLVVSSRQADDRLWAEVLNLGGYDVLAKPFDRAEVVRVIGAAWLHWRQRGVAHAMRRAAAEVALKATA
jgi:DNA-binding response OmpR family regulator